jgi:hypothetical protein
MAPEEPKLLEGITSGPTPADLRQQNTAHQQSHHGQRRPARLQLRLKPLDPRDKAISATVRVGVPIPNLAGHVRNVMANSGHPFPEAAFLQFYDSKGRRLGSGDKITTETAELWYCASTSPDDRGDWMFSRWPDRADAPLDKTLAAAMLEAINAGVTV